MTEGPGRTTPRFRHSDVDIIERQTLYRGFFRAERLRLRHRQFQDGDWGETMARELVYHGHAVGVLLYDPVRDLIALVEQFRVGAMGESATPWCLEIVAGMMKPDESPEDVARRELIEEAGIEQVELRYIGNYLASPGGCDEKLFLYCGLCDLGNAGGIFGLPEEHEDIKVHVLPADEVLSDLFGGRWNNPAALITLQWLQWHREQLRNPDHGC